MEKRKYSKFAIASLIFGFLPFVLLFLMNLIGTLSSSKIGYVTYFDFSLLISGLVAIVFGIFALKQISKNKNMLIGNGLASLGIILGGIIIFLFMRVLYSK